MKLLKFYLRNHRYFEVVVDGIQIPDDAILIQVIDKFSHFKTEKYIKDNFIYHKVIYRSNSRIIRNCIVE